MNEPILEQRAIEYARLCQIPTILESPLGHGTDGSVWKSNRDTAIKAVLHLKNYYIERDCYLRLSEWEIEKIHGFAIPLLHGYNDGLQVIEIGIVEPPFILDFAKCYLNFKPDFSDEVIAQDEAKIKFRFGEKYPIVRRLMNELESCGIYYADPNPDNIEFA